MIICLVSQHYPPETAQGGIGTQTWNKACALSGLGHTVHVLSSAAGPGPDLRTTTEAGVIVHRMQSPGDEPGREFPVYNEPTYWLGYTWAVLRHLDRLTRTTTFDVIDFAEYGAEGLAYQLDRAPANWAPVAVQLHAPLAMLAEHIGWPEKESEFYRVGTFMEGESIRLADRLMACSQNIADFVARCYGIARESIDVVHCGVDANAFRPAEWRRSADGPPTVLFVGNIAGNKGVATVVEAVLRLRSRYPGIRLQILGSGDVDLLRRFKSRIQREGAEANVEFVGFVDRARLPRFYQGADVFCSPAQYEGGVANVYLEAMASGCPVVASTAGGAAEAVVNGQTGLLVPPNDAEAVVAALERLLPDATLRRRMGEAGRQRVEDHFAMDKYIVRVLDAYHKAIEHGRQKLDGLNADVA